MSIRKSVALFLCAASFFSLAACQAPGGSQSSSQVPVSQASSGPADSSVPSSQSEPPASSAPETASPAAPALPNVSGRTKAGAAGANGTGIPYQNMFAGFVSEEGKQGDGKTALPVGDVLLSTEKEWNAFFQKYLQYDSNVNYSAIPGNPDLFDFSKKSILYHSSLSAKEDVYSFAYPIDKIVLGDDHKPALQEKEDFGNGFQITANGSRYIILVSLKKSDLSH